jgi:hypothetical protein
MSANIFYFGGAGILLVLLPFVPRIISLRILALRKIHLFRLADWHERHRERLIPAGRAVMLAIAVALFVIGLR